MTHFLEVDSFDDWRLEARRLLAAGVSPESVHWSTPHRQLGLFDAAGKPEHQGNDSDRKDSERPPEDKERPPDGCGSINRGISASPGNADSVASANVPQRFLEVARQVACHRDPGRWELLYRTVWRLTHGERHLLELVTDADTHRMNRMQKSVSRDVHKMKAFVRFREVVDDQGEVTMVAWHRPDHRIVRLAAPFFARRFKAMNWSILTPHESVSWDQVALQYGPGVDVTQTPAEDQLEDLWRTYYAAIFNPARVKVSAMRREMPVRHWPTLPETRIIDELLEQAPQRVSRMISQREGFDQTATGFMPEPATGALDFPGLATAAEACQACDLHRHASQVVFGRGPTPAKVMIVGEQPGDREDREGSPFVGPAGQLLHDTLTRAGIDRDSIYLTNVVKHFKFVRRGKRRIHQKPDAREIYACRPWLEAEISLVQPETILCLGATAAQALIGRDFRITTGRGHFIETPWCTRTVASWHPSAILRMNDPGRKAEMTEQLLADLRLVR